VRGVRLEEEIKIEGRSLEEGVVRFLGRLYSKGFLMPLGFSITGQQEILYCTSMCFGVHVSSKASEILLH
jgi:hypothetical protein